jgi:hypothetical protein
MDRVECINDYRSDWQQILIKMQNQSLSYCPSFPEVCNRWNDWWRFESEYPLIIAQAPKTKNIRWDKAFDLLNKPQEWLAVRRTQVEETHYVGETLPFIRVDIGPVAMGAFLGAPLHLASKEQTTWQDPVIDSWDNISIKVDLENTWLKRVLTLMEVLAEDACEKYLVCLPDLTGGIDTIANLRGSEKLCADLYEHRSEVIQAANQVVDAWEFIFSSMYNLVLKMGAGITQWVSCWSNTPFTVPTCDFNALIGKDDFSEVCMPSLKDQAQRAGQCVFHLDGPDAARHTEILANDPDITAIQFTPGVATPSTLAKIDLLKMIQNYHVPMFIECPFDETRELMQTLDPRGIAIRVSDIETPQQADLLINWRDDIFN